MNRHAGVGILLSYLIVGLVAVVFYRPDHPPAMAVAGPARATASTTAPASPPAIPPPTPGVPLGETPQAAAEKPVADGPRVARPESPRHDRSSRRLDSTFTRVADGETLADVARRVYGDSEAAGPLWKANRDQLDGPDGPLRAGMILRTP